MIGWAEYVDAGYDCSNSMVGLRTPIGVMTFLMLLAPAGTSLAAPKGTDLVPVRIEVYSPTGRLVRLLVDRPMPVGEYEVNWDGNDQEGVPVGSGVYYYRLLSKDSQESRKMVLVR